MPFIFWVLSALLALAFLLLGFQKVFRYEQTRKQNAWVNSVPRGLVFTIGTLEMLGALGLILPVLTGILPWLAGLAAGAYVLLMLLAMVFHVMRAEFDILVAHVVLGALAALLLMNYLGIAIS